LEVAEGDHPVERRIAPSTRIEEAIEQVLLDGVSSPDELSQLGRLGAQLVLQRAVEDEAVGSRNERAPTPAALRELAVLEIAIDAFAVEGPSYRNVGRRVGALEGIAGAIG
jgi:hypothetical protein